MQMCEIGRDLILSLQNNQIIDNLAIHIINNLARYIEMDDESGLFKRSLYYISLHHTGQQDS
jgi:hypothetical protein